MKPIQVITSSGVSTVDFSTLPVGQVFMPPKSDTVYIKTGTYSHMRWEAGHWRTIDDALPSLQVIPVDAQLTLLNGEAPPANPTGPWETGDPENGDLCLIQDVYDFRTLATWTGKRWLHATSGEQLHADVSRWAKVKR